MTTQRPSPGSSIVTTMAIISLAPPCARSSSPTVVFLGVLLEEDPSPDRRAVFVHYHARRLARVLPLERQDPTFAAMVTAFVACEAARQAAEEAGLASDDPDAQEMTAIRNRVATFLGMPVDSVLATFRRTFKDEEG
jgi:hypothetical protein